MPKIKNLSPKFKVPIAEKELKLLMGQEVMGIRKGGLSLFSDSFKRGYGDAVFGSDSNGIWLGAAEFVDAVFKVNMEGSLQAKEAIFKDEDDTTIVDAKGLVSTANFTAGSAITSESTVITGDNNWTDITGLTHDILLSRNSNVLFWGIIARHLTGSDASALFRINYGGSFYPGGDGWNASSPENDVSTFMPPFSFSQLLVLPQGTTTVKMQGATSTPDETLTISHSGDGSVSTFGYLVLGK